MWAGTGHEAARFRGRAAGGGLRWGVSRDGTSSVTYSSRGTRGRRPPSVARQEETAIALERMRSSCGSSTCWNSASQKRLVGWDRRPKVGRRNTEKHRQNGVVKRNSGNRELKKKAQQAFWSNGLAPEIRQRHGNMACLRPAGSFASADPLALHVVTYTKFGDGGCPQR